MLMRFSSFRDARTFQAYLISLKRVITAIKEFKCKLKTLKLIVSLLMVFNSILLQILKPLKGDDT